MSRLRSWLHRLLRANEACYDVPSVGIVRLMRAQQKSGEWSPVTYPKPQPEKAATLKQLVEE